MHLDRTTRRILGALIEKRYSTPEQYPLTLNALVLACNQKSNRDPETQLEEFLVEGSVRQLRIDQWITVVEREYGRAVRYAERMVEKLGLTDKEAALLAELMLRGPQTEQELPRRCERMTRIGSSEEALAILQGMAGRGLVVRMARETGQRLARWRHTLTPPDEVESTTTVPIHGAVMHGGSMHGGGIHGGPMHGGGIHGGPIHGGPMHGGPVHAAAAAHAPAPADHAHAPAAEVHRPASSEDAAIAAPVLEPLTVAMPTVAMSHPSAPVHATPAGAADVAALRSMVVSLKAEVERLTQRIAKLEQS